MYIMLGQVQDRQTSSNSFSHRNFRNLPHNPRAASLLPPLSSHRSFTLTQCLVCVSYTFFLIP